MKKQKWLKKKMDKNTRLIASLAAFVLFMIGVAYASVPLYTLFCRATGFGGTTQRVAEAPAQTPVQAKDHLITVMFDGNVDSSLPWEFAPETKTVQVKLGEQATVKYRARNKSTEPLVGIATYNVQPDKAGQFFDKIQCFCFTKQVLKAGETVEMPVQFYVDPAMANDRENDDVQNITLSYTFFLAKDQSKARTIKQAHSTSDDDTPNP